MKRIAIIGLGAVTRNIHLPAYASLAGRVTVVGGSDPDAAARTWAISQGIAAVSADPREMIERARPDIVAVCSPPDLHREHAELALAMGCQVFCEKPLASTLEDADAIITAAEARGLHVVVNNQFPAMLIHRAAREMIGGAEFGRLLYLHAWHTNQPTAHTEAGWRGVMRQRLGLEFGIHVLDLVRFFFAATPSRVMAHMPRPDATVSWDSINLVALDFADGRAASAVLDRLSKGPERYLDFRLDGEHAAIHTSIGGQLRAMVGLHTRERRPFVDLRLVGGGRAVLQQGNRSRVIATDPQNPFAPATARHFGAFLDALEAGSSPPASARDNRESLRLVFAAYRSAAEGRSVDVATFSPPPSPGT
ncbi:MAG TPA: Gfo/Idh/MocA family oxidoreductase [Gemmatimonadales bacterium]